MTIFKHGDDLRQDQLILQMITLMDKLLRRENLDLKLTPYKVLATSSKHGFLQYIDSCTVAEVLAREGNILNFFRRHHPCESALYGIAPEVMDTYIKSCAGYCVITYLLGKFASAIIASIIIIDNCDLLQAWEIVIWTICS